MPTTTLAVNIDALVADAGIAIGRNHQPGNNVASIAYDSGSQRIIGVNTAMSPRRQRFAIAHAYAHLQLHTGRQALIVCHQVQARSPKEGSATATAEMEQEANLWAAGLLMPEAAVREELSQQITTAHDSRDQLIDRMAARFEVSPEAMGWRLISLSLITG